MGSQVPCKIEKVVRFSVSNEPSTTRRGQVSAFISVYVTSMFITVLAISIFGAPTTADERKLIDAVRDNRLTVVRKLLNKGGNPDLANSQGSPLLSVASARGHAQAIEALLRSGANPNLRNLRVDGQTALLLAQSHRIAEALLKGGADPNASYIQGLLKGHTPLFSAAMDGDQRMMRLLLKYGARADAQAEDGMTALHWAANCGSLPMVKLLLDRNAKVDARDFIGRTPLMSAVSCTSAPLARRVEVVRYLIIMGANVNARTDENRRAYFRAQFVGDRNSVLRLEQAGVLHTLRETGPSVLDMASEPSIASLLRASGAVKTSPSPYLMH